MLLILLSFKKIVFLEMQMRPNYIPDQDTMDIKNKSSSRTTLQIWRKNGSCPQGTIPIRRVRKKDLLRFKNLETFSSKKQTHSNRSLVIYNTTTAVLGYQPNRSVRTLYLSCLHWYTYCLQSMIMFSRGYMYYELLPSFCHVFLFI